MKVAEKLSNTEVEGIKLQYDVSKVLALTCLAAVASLILFLGNNFSFYNDLIGAAIVGLSLAGIFGFGSAYFCILELRATNRIHWLTIGLMTASFIAALISLFLGVEGFGQVVDKLVAK